MKRLILMGGRPWEGKDSGQNFVEVLFRYFPGSVKVAFCIFAQPETDWQATAERNIFMFTTYHSQDNVQYKTITPNNFAEVSEWADIIYIPGGNPYFLLEKITACGDIAKLWDKKVIAGSSAGADIFCEAYTYLQDRTMGKGLGWIKVTCIPHWRNKFKDYTDKDWDWAEQESIKQHPDLPVICIPEGTFIEFTVK